MKQCPACRTNYTDDTLQFCLSDGARLNAVEDDAKTIQMSAERHPIRVDFQNDSAPTIVPPSAVPAAKKGCSPLIVGGLLIVLLFAFGGIAVAVYLLAPFGTKEIVAANANSNTSPTPKTDAINDDINGKLANLEKQLAEQKKQGQKLNTHPFSTQKPTPLPISPSAAQTAAVAPTGDGFLSLRTEPSVKTGVQLLKIPTGATVNLLGKCQNPGQTADGKKGRWCLVSYNNQTGWVFDAYLNY